MGVLSASSAPPSSRLIASRGVHMDAELQALERAHKEAPDDLLS